MTTSTPTDPHADTIAKAEHAAALVAALCDVTRAEVVVETSADTTDLDDRANGLRLGARALASSADLADASTSLATARAALASTLDRVTARAAALLHDEGPRW